MTEEIQSKYLFAANCKRGPLLFNKHEQIMAYALIVYGEFAEDELSRLERFLKPGMTVIDVGANIGTHATAFGQMVHPGGFVYAFEPHPCNFNILCGNVAMRATQNVYPFRMMCGDTNRTHILPIIDAEKPANFGALHALGADATNGIPTQEVRLDDAGIMRCHLLKIDVEGHELEVLQGAAGVIDRDGPVILAECNEWTDEAASLKAQERIAPFFREHGYRMFWLKTRLHRPDNFRGSTEARDGHDRNILAVREDIPELTEGLEELK